MRIAVTLITMEADTFNAAPTRLDAFEGSGLYRDGELFEHLKGVGMVGGFMAAVEGVDDVELVPLIKARAVAGGRVDAETMAYLEDEMITRLRAAGPLDGFGLLMHGACAAEGLDDVEGHLLAASRAVVGDDLPIVVGLDHHGNITKQMVELATGIVGHRTQPHDQYDTGFLSGQMLLQILRGEVDPVMAWRKLPLLSHQEQYLTSVGPMKTWFDRACPVESDPKVVQVSNFPMQPWLDVEEGGWATVVVTDGDRTLAEQVADDLADLAWSLRHDFQVRTSVSPAEAVAQAQAHDGMVLISDTGDSVFGGAGGDSTVLLTELLRAGGPRTLVPIVDPVVARLLAHHAVGEAVTVAVGGAVAGWVEPVEVTGVIRAVEDPVLRLADYSVPEVFMGSCIAIEVANVMLVVTARPGVAGNHPGLYAALGIDVADFDAAVMKTASNFQWFAAHTTEVIRADTPGPTQSDIVSLPWTRVPRPIFPLDDVDDWRH